MKILATVTLLVLVVAVRAGDPVDSAVPSNADSPDTCDYTERQMCGDQCIGRTDWCYCGFVSTGGSDKIRPGLDDEPYCCGESCTLDRYFWGHCREGRKLSISSHCNTTMQCYNSYQHSLNISHQSHYTCPDTCVPWEAMCRGVSKREGDHQGSCTD